MFVKWKVVVPIALALLAAAPIATAQVVAQDREWWRQENARRAQELASLRERWNRRKGATPSGLSVKEWWRREIAQREREKARLNAERERRKRQLADQERQMRRQGIPEETVLHRRRQFWSVEEPKRRRQENARLRQLWDRRKAEALIPR